ncbi:MAG: S-layer homology domain-containing protein [Clostridiales bacterium]|nr:S-layer homology domain-containing protein [Clostridiales bacterium]
MKKTKKMIALLLSLLLILGSFGTVFAAGETAAPSDVKGTSYEAAVVALMDADVISGYPDGTFRPDDLIRRSEVAKMISLLAGATESDLAAAKDAGFDDMKDAHWAKPYINFAVSKKIINGYPNGTFEPYSFISYNEMAKLLVAAAGVDAASLTGTWPANYVNKAEKMGLLKGLTFDNGMMPITRGEVALMSYNFLQIGKDKPEAEKPETEKPAVKEPTTVQEFVDKHQLAILFGVIQGTCQTENKDGEGVSGVSLLMGTYGQGDLTAEKNSAADPYIAAMTEDAYLDGQVYALRSYNGELTHVGTSAEPECTAKLPYFAELTVNANIDKETDSSFAKVDEWNKDRKVMVFENSVKYNEAIGLGDKCVVYVLDEKNDKGFYTVSDLSAVKKGSLVRVYDAVDDDKTEGNIVVVDVRK